MPTPEEMKAAQEAEAKAQAAAAAAAAQATSTTTAETDDPKALKAEVERLRKIATANGKEAAAHRVKLREVEEQRQKAEQERLAADGKFKELAESRSKEIEALKSELEPLRSFKSENEARANEEKAKREAQVATDFDALPEDVRAEVPADADLQTKQFAIRMYQKAAAQSSATPPAPRAPTLPTTAPRPAGSPSAGLLTPDEEARCAQTIGNPRASPKDKAEATVKLRAHNAAKLGQGR